MPKNYRLTPGVALAALAVLLSTKNGVAQQVGTSDIDANLPTVQAYLNTAAAANDLNGLVLIGRGDSVILEEAYGLAEVEHGVPLQTGHLFRIGSLTKPITASAVLAAVDEGHISLDAPACPLLPSCPRAWHSVTVRHLLTHTSGIPDHFGDLEAVPVENTVEELARALAALPQDAPLRSDPGREYSYSNFNYVLLGAVLENVMAAPWENALRELVFEPLGLTAMRYDDVFAIVQERARGYERGDDGILRNIEYDDHAAYAAGGLLATARDLFRWSRGMLSGRLFSSRLVDESVTAYRADYGYGWQVRRFFDRRVYNHTGGIDGFSSHLAHYPDDELTIIVLSNVENDSAILRACDIAARLFDSPAAHIAGADMTPRQRCGLE